MVIMRRAFFIFYGIIITTSVAHAELIATKFPKTIKDLSFESRVENLTDEYKPFLNKKAYQELDVLPGEEIYTDHLLAVMENDTEQQKQDAINMSLDEYCAKYPDDIEKCPQKQTDSPPSPTTSSSSAIYYSGNTIGGGAVIENNIVTGGSCYPADHDRWYKNKIFTTGRYERQYPAFEKAMITVFRKEGTTCGTIPNDPSGYSCYGISSVAQNIPAEVLSKYTITDAEDLYYNRFWIPRKIYNLPDVISGDVFLAGIASGMGTALIQFRKFLGLTGKSSAVDEELINAVKNYQGDIHNDWINLRDKYLEKVARNRYDNKITYKHAIEIKRKNGCHIRPEKPLYRQ